MGRRGKQSPIMKRIRVTIGSTCEEFLLNHEKLPKRRDAVRRLMKLAQLAREKLGILPNAVCEVMEPRTSDAPSQPSALSVITTERQEGESQVDLESDSTFSDDSLFQDGYNDDPTCPGWMDIYTP
jgi:hypothetical protein